MLQVDRPEGGSALPTRTPADRGWSLDLTASGRLGATLTALVARLGDRAQRLARRRLRPRDRRQLDAQHDRVHRCDGMVGRRLHGRRRRRRAHRYRRLPVDGLDGADKVVYGPDLSLESQAPDLTEPRHERAWHVHGRASSRAKCHRLPRHGARRPDRQRQGRRRRRWHGRQPGHRRDRLGRAASQGR